MGNFANSYLKYVNHLEQINDAAQQEPERMVCEIEESYHDQIRRVARTVAGDRKRCRIVMLSGPSSSGKTTTAHLLADELKGRGVDCGLVSLDNFYRGEKQAPLLPDGQHDYESVDALDIPRLESCLTELTSKNSCELPVFDFTVRRPADYTRHMELGENGVAIVEGIHALNPRIIVHLPRDRICQVYVSVKQGIKDRNGMVLDAVELRLLRRLVRDFKFRGTDPERTLRMWPNVLAGENKYIRPFKMGCDVTINSIHIYEPCVLRKYALPLLRQGGENPEYRELTGRLAAGLERFSELPDDLVPKTSIIREFIGGGLYGG